MKHESYVITGCGARPSENRRYQVYAGTRSGSSLNEFPAWVVGQCTDRRDLEQLRDAVQAELLRIAAEDQAESERIAAEEREAETYHAAEVTDDLASLPPDAEAELPTEAEPFRGARGVPVDDGGQQGAVALPTK